MSKADFWAKDLRHLTGPGSGRDLKDIIVVDNLISNFIYHTQYCVPIKDFNGDEHDQELRALTQYLISLKEVERIPEQIASDFYNPLFEELVKEATLGQNSKPDLASDASPTSQVNLQNAQLTRVIYPPMRTNQ